MKKSKQLECPKTQLWTIDDVVALNPHMLTKRKLDITIRSRLTAMKEENLIAEVASIPGGKGRPRKVYAKTPITKTILAKAEQAGYVLAENINKLVNVVSVGQPSINSTPTSQLDTVSA